MKARPRSVENRVAEELTAQLRELGFGITLRRVPAPGYPWPDLTWPNDLDLAVEIKSRKSIPRLPEFAASPTGDRYFVPLGQLALTIRGDPHLLMIESEPSARPSKTVEGWMAHLRETVGACHKLMLVLHRPGSPILSATVVMPRDTVDLLGSAVDA